MNGGYGSMLAAFPEQFDTVEYFDMAPQHGSGWGPRTDKRQIDAAVLQCTEGRKVKDSNGNLVVTRKMELWTEELLLSGRFVEFEEDGVMMVYRISGDNEWRRESGFTVYGLDKVVGSDGTETVEPTFATGAGSMS